MINEYKFGSININGKVFKEDVEVRWNGEILSWWRKEGHLVDVDDLKRAIEQNPEIVVIGTGESGMMKITEQAQDFLHKKGVKLIIDKTEEAVKTFNVILENSEETEEEKRRIIGLFHLTC